MQKYKKFSRGGKDENAVRNYAAIDLGTNSCRLVIASPTPTSFHIIETFSRITRLGEGIIKENELSREASRRTIKALKICSDPSGALCRHRRLPARQKLPRFLKRSQAPDRS